MIVVVYCEFLLPIKVVYKSGKDYIKKEKRAVPYVVIKSGAFTTTTWSLI